MIASSKYLEGVMRKIRSQAVAQRAQLSQEAYVGLWSTALWILAAIYLMTTFSIY